MICTWLLKAKRAELLEAGRPWETPGCLQPPTCDHWLSASLGHQVEERKPLAGLMHIRNWEEELGGYKLWDFQIE